MSYSNRLAENPWRFESPAGPVEIPVGSRFGVNNREAVREVALEHHGIALLPTFVVWRDLAEGALQRLLSQWPVHGLFG
nr:LysR substrate-binding domain-containing protein [Nitrogeniibacter mangrovi]